MWNETPEVAAIREALGLFSATLLHVCPGEGTHAQSKGVLSGLLFVFESVAVFDPRPSRTVEMPLERDVIGESEEGLCRWFADENASVEWNSHHHGLDIRIAGDVSFRFTWIDAPDAAFNALAWTFDWEARRTQGRELSLSSLGAILYPDATQRLRNLQKRTGDENAVDDNREFVVADLDGAIITNRRLFFATSAVPLAQIAFMTLQPSHIIIVLSAYTRVKVKCSAFRQALLLRKWLLSVLDDHEVRTNDQPRLLTMMALHRQFCAVDNNSDGFLTEEEFNVIVSPVFSNRLFTKGFFRIMDVDRSGAISFAEFAVGLMDLLGDDLETRIRFTFGVFDVNDDGGIEKPEMLEVLRSLQHTGDVISAMSDADLRNACDQLFRYLDTNNDGVVTMEEYTKSFTIPEVYSLLCNLGLAGDRSTKRTREISVALVAPSSAAWCTVSRVMHAVRILVDQVHLTDVTGNPNVPCRVIGLKDHPDDGSVVVYRAEVFRKLHQRWHLSAVQFEESFGIDNVAANLLLGSPRIPNLISIHDTSLISHDRLFSVFRITPEQLTHVLQFIPDYAAYVARNPNTMLSNVVGVLTVTTGNVAEHLAVVKHRLHRRPALRVELPQADPSKPLHPIVLDSGWYGVTLGQLESDLQLLAQRGYPQSVTVTCGVPMAVLNRKDEFVSDAGARAKESDTTSVQTVGIAPQPPVHTAPGAATKTKGKTPAKKSAGSGFCCGGSEVKQKTGMFRPVHHTTTAASSKLPPVAPATNTALSPVTSAGQEIYIEVFVFPGRDPFSGPPTTEWLPPPLPPPHRRRPQPATAKKHPRRSSRRSTRCPLETAPPA
jgi:Ca2+-binding EF-hand superfamily protein